MVGKQERRYQRMITVVLALISLIMVIPLVLLVVASFTSNNEIVLHGYFQKSRYNTNNASLIARKIPVPQEKQINFSVAILVCKQFLKGEIRPAQIFGILSRVYLKTHDVTGSEGFLRCARHFFAGILTYFKEK